jgi:hypothetical protein
MVTSGGPGMMSGAGGFRRPSFTEQPAAETTDNKKNLQRTEFIILFVWKEPTPSDALLPQDEAPAEGAAEGAASSGAAPTGSAAPEAPPTPGRVTGKSGT